MVDFDGSESEEMIIDDAISTRLLPGEMGSCLAGLFAAITTRSVSRVAYRAAMRQQKEVTSDQ
jgi:hypothetical protein